MYTPRSAEWFVGESEISVMHRVALRNSGVTEDLESGRPLIGIADSSSTLNPCNLPLRSLVEDAERGIREAGGIPVVFPVMSLGEDLMKPTAMLYRNLLSIEVEEYARAYPLDGLILLAGCDKSLPGALMGAASANLPTLAVVSGPRAAGVLDDARLGTGTALWRADHERQSGTRDSDAWKSFERALACGPGTCNTMGTASTLAILTEVLGFMLPGTAGAAAGSVARAEAAYRSGITLTETVLRADPADTPQRILTESAFRNALVALCALGGSPNAVIHLIALAGRVGITLDGDTLDRISREVPVIADIEPAGAGLLADFDRAGGTPALLHTLDSLIDANLRAADGRPWRTHLRAAESVPERSPVATADGTEAHPVPGLDATAGDTGREPSARPGHPAGSTRPIRPLTDPVAPEAFAVLRGNLAPRGSLLRLATAPELRRVHTGPALVWHSYAQMRREIHDPTLAVTPDTVLVLTGAGPVGAPGMPEWGVIPIPRVLAAQGVTDMLRISDGRMSGTAFGSCIVHVSPEAAIGGPIGLLRTGDLISLDLDARSLNVDLTEAELAVRLAAHIRPEPADLRGWPLLYRRHVGQADTGCDFDFLTAHTPEQRRVVQPVVGLS
ncbi:dihydroxy-acid dehydratase [Mycetocola saprophilus]|uniref:dihydroxy-acid dehydratase domain-containing protein n=1 Tax=Mycetocola saprophilus TaxID=76636 RepID=UPI0004BF17BD|nr:dihydroxy-acid dehydratase [Mycetocola saprophilus]